MKLDPHVPRLIVAALLLISATSLLAEPLSIETYQKYKNEKFVRSYLSGVMQAYGFANASLEIDKKPRLFCLPEKLALNVDNVFQMIDESLKENPKLRKSTPVEGVALFKLQETFPCK